MSSFSDTWTEIDGVWHWHGYLIAPTVRGWEVFIYGEQSRCLGREIATVGKAKSFCEKHREPA